LFSNFSIEIQAFSKSELSKALLANSLSFASKSLSALTGI